jgi:hypothetical protein
MALFLKIANRRILLLWLALGLVVGSLAVSRTGALIVVIAATLIITSYVAASPALFKFVILLALALKPIIDLGWRLSVGTFLGQNLNLQTLIGVYIILLLAVAWLFGRPTVLSVPLVSLVALASVSVFMLALFSGNQLASGAEDLLRLISGLSLYFVAGAILINERIFLRFAWILLAAITVPLILSLLQIRGVIPYEYWDWIDGVRTGRLSGSYPHPLNLAGYLVYGHLLALYLVSHTPHFRRRIVLLLWVGLLYYVLYYTYHRTTYVVIALQLVGWLYLHRQRIVGLLVIAAGGIAIFVQRGTFQNLYSTLFSAISNQESFLTQSFLRGRGEQWNRYLNDFVHSHPLYWLFGRGNALLVRQYSDYGLAPNEPHNDFLRIMYTYGVFGLIAYLSCLLMFCIMALYVVKKAVGSFEKDIAYLVLLSVSSIAILSLTTEPMRYPTMVWYLFTLGSMITVMYRRLKLTCLAPKEKPDGPE